ncbi:MAG: zf-HC2 domain-containing protein, partial [Pseudonocardiaceae bacterium]
MNCEPFRESLSARIDGEASDLSNDLIDDHLATCAACRQWATSVEDVALASRLGPAHPIPDLTDRILANLPQTKPAAVDRWSLPVRWALGAVAVAQIVLTLLPLLFGAHRGTTVHVSHELGTWNIALAVGMLFVAVRPARAWGMLPLVAILVGFLLVISGVDIILGNAMHGRETFHALELAGLSLLRVLAGRPLTRRAP